MYNNCIFIIFLMTNLFKLTQQQSIHIKLMLITGFSLVKKQSLIKSQKSSNIKIQYTPKMQQQQSANSKSKHDFRIKQSTIQTKNSLINKNTSCVTSKISTRSKIHFKQINSKNGKSLNKHKDRIKIIIHNLKKHKKFDLLTNYLRNYRIIDLGQFFQQTLDQQYTVQIFKQSIYQILQEFKELAQSKGIDYERQLASQMLMFIKNIIQEESQLYFNNNLNQLQNQGDIISKELRQIQNHGQYYIKKNFYKKQRCTIKSKAKIDIIHVCDLIKKLPKAYLIGVWEIIYEKPFREKTSFEVIEVDLSKLSYKKLRDIQIYAIDTLKSLKRSRESKMNKIKQTKNAKSKQQMVNNSQNQRLNANLTSQRNNNDSSDSSMITDRSQSLQ